MTTLPPLIRAVLWFCGTMVGFAAMAVSARQLQTTMSAFEILFFRSLIGVLAVLPFIIRNRFRDVRTTNIKFHSLRAVVQFSAQICWMYGIAYLTLSDLTAIEFSVPVFTAVLAVIFLGERIKHLLRYSLGNMRPNIYHLIVTLTISNKPVSVLFIDPMHLFMRFINHWHLIFRNAHVIN